MSKVVECESNGEENVTWTQDVVDCGAKRAIFARGMPIKATRDSTWAKCV